MAWPVRGVAAVALCASGVLTVAAAAERWWPACRWGRYDTAACLRVQDDAFHYLPPFTPVEELARAAELAGWSMVALAVAALFLPFAFRPHLWLRGPRHRVGEPVASPAARPAARAVALLVAVVPCAALAVGGASLVHAAQTRQPFADSVATQAAAFIWVFAWPTALTGFAAFAPGLTHRAQAVTVSVLVGLSTPLPVFILAPIVSGGYVSYDAMPWAEATGAVFLLAAAAVLCLGEFRAQRGAAAALRTEEASARS